MWASTPSRCWAEIRSFSMADWPVPLVADRNLALAVRPQVVEDAALADLGETAGQGVCQRDRERHQLLGLLAGVAEHHPLVAGPNLVQILVDLKSTPWAISADCGSMETITPQVSASKPNLALV